MQKLLIISGPTATGKTSFGLEIAKKFNGEILSADSRQVYIGMDIVTGKDLPLNIKYQTSNIKWKNRYLKYYLFNNIKVWLYDIVSPDEPFNVSFWKECADLVIADIFSRGKLPIVVGGTGLYLKSLTQPMSQISIPPNPKLRKQLEDKSPEYLFDYLHRLNPLSSVNINRSDRFNPRRLIRAIEIALHHNLPPLKLRGGSGGCYEKSDNRTILHLCLTAPKDYLYSRIDQRVDDRIKAGAIEEAQNLLKKYSPDLPSMTSCGYRAFLDPDPVAKWKTLEHQYARRQLIWFKKKSRQIIFDISQPDWKTNTLNTVQSWYNKNTIT